MDKKSLRGIQCILLAMHGVVGPKREFFEKAFGRNFEEFKNIILMPEDYIIHRKAHEANGSTQKWQTAFDALMANERKEALSIIQTNSFDREGIEGKPNTIKKLVRMYL